MTLFDQVFLKAYSLRFDDGPGNGEQEVPAMAVPFCEEARMLGPFLPKKGTSLREHGMDENGFGQVR